MGILNTYFCASALRENESFCHRKLYRITVRGNASIARVIAFLFENVVPRSKGAPLWMSPQKIWIRKFLIYCQIQPSAALWLIVGFMVAERCEGCILKRNDVQIIDTEQPPLRVDPRKCELEEEIWVMAIEHLDWPIFPITEC